MTSELILYVREGCALCEDFKAMLLEYDLPRQFRIELRDVDDEPEWEAYYGELLPILFAGDVEICRYYFEPASLDDWIAS